MVTWGVSTGGWKTEERQNTKWGGGGGGGGCIDNWLKGYESHVIDWEEAKVVDTHARYQRCALESWHIRSETTTEMMAAYHRLITPSSTTRANHTPHTRPHSALSIFNCILSLTSSQLLIIHILFTIYINHHIDYPQFSWIHLFTIHSSLYPLQMFNPKLRIGLSTHVHTATCIPTHLPFPAVPLPFSGRPTLLFLPSPSHFPAVPLLPVCACTPCHVSFDLPLMTALVRAEMFGNCVTIDICSSIFLG